VHVFHNFSESNIQSEPEPLPAEFKQAAAPAAPPRVTVALDMDADVLEWLKAQPLDWQTEINNLARFYMETSQAREAAFAPDAWEPGEMQESTGPTAAP
jgi:uncharacterized protein (DUF4415 family)